MKTDRVVCIKGGSWGTWEIRVNIPDPIKGEIYTVSGIVHIHGYPEYCLVEMGNKYLYNAKHFRPTDDTFGELVCERVSEMIEYEKVIPEYIQTK